MHEGLHFLHKDFRNEKQFKRPPIAHRDFKSENILFLNFDHTWCIQKVPGLILL